MTKTCIGYYKNCWRVFPLGFIKGEELGNAHADKRGGRWIAELRINLHRERTTLTIIASSVADPDPYGSGTFAWIRNYSSGSGSRKKIKEQINKKCISSFGPVNSGLCVLYCRTVVWNWFRDVQICLNNMGWIRIRNTKNYLVAGHSGSATLIARLEPKRSSDRPAV